MPERSGCCPGGRRRSWGSWRGPFIVSIYKWCAKNWPNSDRFIEKKWKNSIALQTWLDKSERNYRYVGSRFGQFWNFWSSFWNRIIEYINVSHVGWAAWANWKLRTWSEFLYGVHYTLCIRCFTISVREWNEMLKFTFCPSHRKSH